MSGRVALQRKESFPASAGAVKDRARSQRKRRNVLAGKPSDQDVYLAGNVNASGHGDNTSCPELEWETRTIIFLATLSPASGTAAA